MADTPAAESGEGGGGGGGGVYCIFFILALHTLRPTREFGLTALKSKLTYSPNTKNTHLYMSLVK